MITTKHGYSLCNKCRHIEYYAQEQRQSSIQIRDPHVHRDEEYVPVAKRKHGIMSIPPSVSLPISYTSKSHSYCFICKTPGPKLVVVSPQARFSVFLQREVLIPAGCCCCPGHLNDNNFTQEAISNISCISDNILLSRTSIIDLWKTLRTVAMQNEHSKIDFDSDNALSSSNFANLTGVSNESFDELCSYIKEYVRNTPTRTSRTSLGIFLFKMKFGISNKVPSTILSMSRSSLRRAISSVGEALKQTCVPQNLGLQHITRKNVIKKHTRPLAQTIFGNVANAQAILVLEGTLYLKICNSSENVSTRML